MIKMGVLEWLFWSEALFPMAPDQDHIFGKLSEEVSAAAEQFQGILDDTQRKRFQAYSEKLEQFHDRERQLAYENGFLFATALWLEILGRLENAEL